MIINNINSLFIIAFSTGALFVLAGLLVWLFPPKKINSLYGYRTNRSMQNFNQWHFAQIYSAKIMILLGTLKITVATFSLKISISENFGVFLGLTLLIGSTIAMFILTEKAIAKKFGKL